MKTRLLFLVTILLTSIGTINAEVIFVDSNATGTNLGWNWANAYTQLQDALDRAVSGDEVWVAKGTYLPTATIGGSTNRYKAFQMVNNVSIFGGFAGTETAVAQRTDYGFGGTNETILSGDFNGNDVISGSGSTLSITGNTENAYHVFNHPAGYLLGINAVLDGFTIKGGNANGNANPLNDGAGIYNQEGQSPSINNCYFIGNRASDNGGAYFGATAADPNVTNCTFALNYASDAGGAIGNYDSDPTITNCLFYGNRAVGKKGGAIYNYSASNPTITNSTITENSSVSGGGIYNEDNSDVTIINSIIYGNTITTGVGPQIRNFTNSDLTLSFSNIEGGIAGIHSTSGGSTIDGGGNIDADPQFVGSTLNALHPYSIWGTSPCADAGNGGANAQAYDIRGAGYGRKLSKTDGTAGTIDIGAYEFNINSDPVNIGRYYVDVDASGNDNGSNWTNAFTSFQSALDIAVTGDEIWVAAGTYKPSSPYNGPIDSRYYHFRMINGVTIYGGFAGTETTAADRTNYRSGGANETILSGDIGTPDDNSDNCYHVFYHPDGLGLDATAVIDGFTITGGNANLGSAHTWGGGMYNYSSSPSIINCTFINNTALVFGGGICNYVNSSTIIENSIFINNTAAIGGGLSDFSSSSNISNSTFKDNTSTAYGGGLFFRQSSSTVINCLITGNLAQTWGGGIYFRDGSPTIINSTITNSYSEAIYCFGAGATPIFTNTIIWGNNGSVFGNDSGGYPTYYYCDIEGSGGSSSWDTNLGTDGGNNIDANPRFVGSAVSAEHPYLIYGISPCADAGDNGAISEPYDIRGNDFARKLNKADGSAGTVDMGAYEYKFGIDPYAPPAIYVDDDASGSNDGTSWINAYTSLQSALNEAVTGQEIWVAKGTYHPSSAYDLTNTSRYYHFRMIDGVAIYGGFAGTESATSERTNYGAGEANETILSGDFNNDDVISGSGSTLSITNNTENSYHVFYHPSGMNLTTTAILDGFTISGGKSDGIWPHMAGGGMFNDGASPTINNCSFTGNTVTDSGGGIYNRGFSTPNISNSTFFENSSKYGGGIDNTNSSPNVNNCSFSGNYASWYGGGVRNNDYSTTPSFTNCNFSGNYAGNGGGMFTNQSTAPVITNCLFVNNSTQYDGGGLYIANCSPTLVNCTFSQNTASRNGGGIIMSGATFTPSISNTIVWDNTASSSGAEIYILNNSNPTFSYCNIEGSGGSSSWAGVTFGTDGGNNIDANPQFVGSGDYPYLIYGNSPCTDAGNNGLNAETTDIRGGSFGRKLSKVDGTAGTIDMGAYEYKFGTDPLSSPVIWDGSASSDWNTAANWSGNAVPTASDNVIIPTVATNNPVIAALASADCNNLTINSGATLTIQSTVAGTGSLITAGTFTNNGTFTVERYLSDAAWHFVAPSTTGVTANDFYWNDAPVCWLTSHNETDDLWTYNTDLATTMPLGKGWSAWVDDATKSSAIVTMTGDIQATDLTVNLAKNGNGWNLIGNPFTSAIDSDAINWTSASRVSFTTGTQYVWDNNYNGGDYRTWNGSTGDLTDGIIPISQAFFVKAIFSGDLNIPLAARVHNSTDIYKSTESESPYVRLQLDFENHGNTVFIGFPENGTDYFDNKGDATKLYSNDEFPQLYAVEDGIKLSTNALAPLNGESKTVPLQLDQVVDGAYTFTISQLENLPDMMVSLEDLQTGTIHDLGNNPVYTFNASKGDDMSRFLLHFKSATFGINEDLSNENEYMNIYTANNSIYINSKGAAVHESGIVEVYSIIGQKLLDQKINAGNLIRIPFNANNSYLVVRVQKPSGTVVKKVFTK